MFKVTNRLKAKVFTKDYQPHSNQYLKIILSWIKLLPQLTRSRELKELLFNCMYEDLQDLLELTPTKDVLFIIGDWNANVGSQETPWSNRQIWLWSTEWSRAKANRVLPREHTGHSKHPLPTTQEKTLYMDITRWPTLKSDLIIFFAAKDGEALYSQQKQDWELTVAQIMNSLLPNSDWNQRKWRKPLDHSVMT